MTVEVFEFTTTDLGTTHALGEAIAPLLQPGDVVSLTGEPGAGKTSLVQGIARGLGVSQPVVSPTFTLIREYDGRLHVNHLDVYRLDRLQDVIDLGFEEMVDSGGVTFIEWGDAIEGLLGPHLEIEITVPDPDVDARLFRIHAADGAWAGRELALRERLGEWGR